MKHSIRFLALAGLSAILLPACERAVSYDKDIRPILAAKCQPCHQPGGEGLGASGLSLESYDALMKGTRFGPVVKPGDSLTSALNMLVEGRADPSLKMPHGDAEGLSVAEIELLKRWVDQGAKP